MRQKISESVEIPSGISAMKEGEFLICKKGNIELKRKFHIPGAVFNVEGNSVIFSCEKANKNEYKKIKSAVAHLKNQFSGLNKEFEYKLEACNVHFPMTLKVESNRLIINNFLGEKVSRTAAILPNVNVAVKGPQITVTSHDREAAGQTAANFEKSTKIKNRDRRVFQDGIFLVEKPGRAL